MSFTVGIDVGGTNTDVAIIHGTKVIGWSKSPTTEKIIDGFVSALKLALDKAVEDGHTNILSNIKRVNIGTTQFINAVIKRENLTKVACIRLCGVSTRCAPPFIDFSKDLRKQVDGSYYLLDGGLEYNMQPISEIKEDKIIETLKKIMKDDVQHISVSGVFSPTEPFQEKIVGDLITKHYSKATVTLSHQLGHIGLIERGNASILNESLKKLCKTVISGFKTTLNNFGLDCPIFFTQNDGTLIR